MFKLAISHATLIAFPGVFWGLGAISDFGVSQTIGFSRSGVTGGEGEGDLMDATGCCDWEIRVKSDIMEEMSDLVTSSFANMVGGC
jgi:hypothetical protein